MARPNYALNSYTGAATAAVLVGSGIGATDTVLTVSGTNSTWSPLGSNGGFFLTVDYGTISEEKIFVPSGSWVYTNSPITFSGVTRGVDNTTAVTHISGGFITPVFTSTEASEANFVVSSLVGDGPQLTTNSLTISGALTVSGTISASNNKITNLAAGSISTDAVNYGQYLTLSGNIGTISGSLVTLTGDVSTISGSLTTISGIAYSALPLTGGTMTGQLVAIDISVSGLTGATAPSRYVGGTTSGAPTTGTFAVGDFVIDQSGQIWICTTAGTPGTWTKAGGGATLPTGVLAYVANAGSNNVSVIEVATNQVIYTIPVGTSPIGVAITPDGSHVYVSNFGDGTVSVIATASNTVTATVTVGTSPRGVAVTPDGSHVYVANAGSNTVSVIATASNTVTATVTVGTGPYSVAIASSNIAASSAVVTSQGASLATAVTLTASATTTVMSLTLAPGTWVVVSQVDLLTAAVSGGKYTLATTLPVGPSPAGSVFVDETATASEITLSLTQVVTISAAATYNITVTNSTATAATAQIANTGYTAWMI